MVIPLSDCIARPSEPGQPPKLLIDHLEAVAKVCGDPAGAFEDRLAFLAGLAHDAIKATSDWQHYIRGGSAKGPPHAPSGAALFAFWAEDLVSRWVTDRSDQERLYDLVLDWVRVIHRHHGSLGDLLEMPPWDSPTTRPENEPAVLLATSDRDGLDALVRKHFPELTATLGNFDAWLGSFGRTWKIRQGKVRSTLFRASRRKNEMERLGLRVAELGARLIYADRQHAADWKPVSLLPSKADQALQRFENHCRCEAERARRTGVSEVLLRARQEIQNTTLEAYQREGDSHLLSLLLPTGYGKTLAGLRIAIEAVRSGRCRRILYVAPYISILSQSAAVLEKATGIRVVLHHQMSILSFAGEDRKSEGADDRQREDHQPYDHLDTWQAPIIATTFNQLFRALFPSRAQECLRIPALDEKFIFIDEPQIIDPVVWSAFLRALVIVARQRRAQVLFCTATLPPLDDGLGDHDRACTLAKAVSPVLSRFVIRSVSEPWNADLAAVEARKRLKSLGSVAVILNTVRDAVDVWRKLRASGERWFFLASRMLPGHKEQLIRRIRKALKENAGPVGVVCTQVLEAGVDLSFRAILRARPIFPSIVQAAGRGNRHGEGAPAEVLVFSFVRDDGQETRRRVYTDKTANQQTDCILQEGGEIHETDVAYWLDEYYRRCWEANPHTTSLLAFEAAARGKWSVLAGKEPFQEDLPGKDVFVPGAERFLPRRYQWILETFGVETAEDFLKRYLDPRARRGLSFKDRRLQSALLRQFLVELPTRHACRVSHPVNEIEWPLVMDRRKDYRISTGLAHLLSEEDEGDGTKVC